MTAAGSPRQGPVVLLGVCGGIAAYKSVEVLRGLQRAGCTVRPCLTESATRFVGPLTFEALVGTRVPWGRLGAAGDAEMAHVESTRGADLFVVAPATANLLGKLAAGIADDWLTTFLLANEAPLLLAPAMNTRMWNHPAVQANLTTLRARGAHVVPPADGDLACGEVGAGRLAEPEAIVAQALALLAPAVEGLAGRRVLVTSGPTFEDLDPVRFLGNRSSGRMGQALAGEAIRAGAEVVLVTGPVSLPAPTGCRVLRVRSAEEMAAAVRAELAAGFDLAILAAAVADFRPASADASKISREGRDRLDVALVRTADILAETIASGKARAVVGFAAETTDDLEAAGAAKLARKGCDLLVANRVGGPRSTFDAEDAEVLILGGRGGTLRPPAGPKRDVARHVLRAAAEVLASKSRP